MINKFTIIVAFMLFTSWMFGVQSHLTGVCAIYAIALNKIGVLWLFYLLAKQFVYRNDYQKSVLMWLRVYCITFTLLLSWYFLPQCILLAKPKVGSDIYLTITVKWFNYIWSGLSLALFLNYIVFNKKKLFS